MLPEVWLRGPLENIPALLQPAAHALLQAREEIDRLLKELPDALLWEQPAGLASPAFHLQHMAGVLDRMITYAQSQPLSPSQLQYLRAEGVPDKNITVTSLQRHLQEQLDRTLQVFSQTDEKILPEPRTVGRQHLPSTVIGMLFHAAEHTMRHTGQLLVTVKVLLHHTISE